MHPHARIIETVPQTFVRMHIHAVLSNANLAITKNTQLCVSNDNLATHKKSIHLDA